MAADYLVSSLQPLTLDGRAPYTAAQFLDLCRSQLSAADATAVAAVMECTPSAHPIAERWRDLDTQIRNVIASERARLHGRDAAKWRRPARGCSIYWANRASAAFQEKDPVGREDLLDRIRWDAAGELVPPAAPLSTAAAFAYAIRLGIVLNRSARDSSAGKDVFERIASATRIDFKEQRT